MLVFRYRYRYTDYEYVYDDVKPRKNVVPFKSIVDNVASFVSKGMFLAHVTYSRNRFNIKARTTIYL